MRRAHRRADQRLPPHSTPRQVLPLCSWVCRQQTLVRPPQKLRVNQRPHRSSNIHSLTKNINESYQHLRTNSGKSKQKRARKRPVLWTTRASAEKNTKTDNTVRTRRLQLEARSRLYQHQLHRPLRTWAPKLKRTATGRVQRRPWAPRHKHPVLSSRITT